MKNLKSYRKVALQYLYSRASYLTEPVDQCLDSALREISGLPLRPEDADEYNGILGMKPVVEQRKLCIKLLKQRVTADNVTHADLLLDTAVRKLNNLPVRPKGNDPYSALFKLKSEPAPVKSGLHNVSVFSTSESGIDLIHSFESYRRCTYKDPGSSSGLPITGGWGSTRLNGAKLQLGQCYDQEIWDGQFKRDLKYFEDAVKKYVKVPLNQHMFDALVSFTYNCGVGALSGSTAIRRLNKADYKGCADAMTWWNKGANGKKLVGLVRRREAEKQLFLK